MHLNPDSWEGWYWGAQHHFGNSLRVGVPGTYGTVEDCLKECEMMVFWSSDPETTSGAYAGSEGTQRRLWAKELGIEFVHIDPHCTPTAQLLGGRWIPIRPGTDAALAAAIMQVWVCEGLYDKEYVEKRTTGFDAWRDYLLGKDDGLPKTPEWQEAETGVPAHVVRALARAWGRKKTYLGAGGAGAGLGGACRTATGAQWARSMILMMAMQGWGKPGINFGNLQGSTPLDFTFYFPGYAEGGISGDLVWTASAISNYERMPHVLTMNPVKQMIPRQRFPEAIIEGKCKGYLFDGSSLEAQFAPFEYPMPGIFAGAHALPLRRFVFRHHRELAPLHRGLPSPFARVRRQPVDLVRGRGEVRRRDPARLHVVRALGHRRVGQRGRVRPPCAGPTQPPCGRAAAQVHRAARRIEVRLPDLPRRS